MDNTELETGWKYAKTILRSLNSQWLQLPLLKPHYRSVVLNLSLNGPKSRPTILSESCTDNIKYKSIGMFCFIAERSLFHKLQKFRTVVENHCCKYLQQIGY